MKILHFSDSHLWLGLENTSRENDFYSNFRATIQQAIDENVDIIIHTGDLFHTAKPSNKAISVAIESFLKIAEKHIPFIMIAGNHDTPRLSTTTHAFEIFQKFPNFHIFYEPKIHALDIKGIRFVCLPHIHDENIFKEQFKEALSHTNSQTQNIFLSHFWLSSQEYDEYTDEISGVNISLEELKILKTFDYVALWHYHKQFCIGNMCYPWSGEHTSFNQKNYQVGYNVITTTPEISITKYQLPTRNMLDFGVIDCSDFASTQELIISLEKLSNFSQIPGSIVKIIFENISDTLLLDFDEKLIYNTFREAFYFEYRKIKANKKETKDVVFQSWGNIIYDNFSSFMEKYPNIESPEEKQKIFEEIKHLLKTLS